MEFQTRRDADVFEDELDLLEACRDCPKFVAQGISACEDCIYGAPTDPNVR